MDTPLFLHTDLDPTHLTVRVRGQRKSLRNRLSEGQAKFLKGLMRKDRTFVLLDDKLETILNSELYDSDNGFEEVAELGLGRGLGNGTYLLVDSDDGYASTMLCGSATEAVVGSLTADETLHIYAVKKDVGKASRLFRKVLA